jgi:hypothetical protein
VLLVLLLPLLLLLPSALASGGGERELTARNALPPLTLSFTCAADGRVRKKFARNSCLSRAASSRALSESPAAAATAAAAAAASARRGCDSARLSGDVLTSRSFLYRRVDCDTMVALNGAVDTFVADAIADAVAAAAAVVAAASSATDMLRCPRLAARRAAAAGELLPADEPDLLVLRCAATQPADSLSMLLLRSRVSALDASRRDTGVRGSSLAAAGAVALLTNSGADRIAAASFSLALSVRVRASASRAARVNVLFGATTPAAADELMTATVLGVGSVPPEPFRGAGVVTTSSSLCELLASNPGDFLLPLVDIDRSLLVTSPLLVRGDGNLSRSRGDASSSSVPLARGDTSLSIRMPFRRLASPSLLLSLTRELKFMAAARLLN